MELNHRLIANILKEKGMLDFKPIMINDEELWGYRTKEESISVFHFCNSELKELTRLEIGLSSDPLFIYGNAEEYRLIEEREELKNNSPYNFMVDSNNVILSFGIKGYVRLNDNYYVLEPLLNESEIQKRTGIIKPNIDIWKSGVAYNVNKKFVFYYDEYQRPHNYSYLWSYKSFHLLSNIDGGYLVISGSKEYDIPTIPSFWVTEYEVNYIVYLNSNGNIFYLNIIDVNSDKTNKIEFTPHNLVRHEYDDKTYIVPPYSEEHQFFADNNIICVVMHSKGEYDIIDSTILIANRNQSNYYYYGDFGRNRDFISIKNGIITLKEKYNITDLGYSYSTRYVLKDLYYTTIGEYNTLSSLVAFYTKSKRLLGDDSFEKDKDYTLYGVLDTKDMSVIIPARYESVTIYGSNYFVVGNSFDVDGEKKILYGLLCGCKLIVPIEFEKVSCYIEESGLYVIVGKSRGNNNKKKIRYGLLHNGKLVLPIKYEAISSDKQPDTYLLKYRGKYGLWNKGNILLPIKYEEITAGEYPNTYFLNYKGKLGLLYKGNVALSATNDSITIEKEYAIFDHSGKKGLFSLAFNHKYKLLFNDVIIPDNDKYLIGDNNVYHIEDKELKLILSGQSRLSYLCSMGNYFMFRINAEKERNNPNSYECYHVNYWGRFEFVQMDRFVDSKIDNGYIYIGEVRSGVFFTIDEGYLYYDVEQAEFCKVDDLAQPYDSDPDEGVDWDRETYDALGGNDYDRWKEEGGDIDSMMDGLGY